MARENNSSRVFEVLGLWAAAAVGVWAIIASKDDAEKVRADLLEQVRAYKDVAFNESALLQAQATAFGEQATAFKNEADAIENQNRALKARQAADAAHFKAQLIISIPGVVPLNSTGGAIPIGPGGPTQPVASFLLSPGITNFGQTAAVEVKYWWLIQFQRPGEEPLQMNECPNITSSDEEESSREFISEHSVLTMTPNSISLKDAIESTGEDADKNIYIQGSITYSDVFGNASELIRWCKQVIFDDARRGRMHMRDVF